MSFPRSIVTRFRAANVRRIERRRLRKRPTDTPEGFLYKGPKSQKSNGWEVNERRFLNKILQNYDTFINVGAHYGYYCCMARKAGLKVIAFEPVTVNFKMLMDNLKANQFGDDCTLINAAAGSKPTIGEIAGAFSTATMLKGAGHDPSLVETVPVVPIDTVLPQIDGTRTLVLMDVEGFEHQALLGAGGLLKAGSTTDWIVEIFPHFTPKDAAPVENADYFSAFDLMFQANYQAWRIGDPFTKIDPEDLAAQKQKPFLERTSGNFFFSFSTAAVTMPSG